MIKKPNKKYSFRNRCSILLDPWVRKLGSTKWGRSLAKTGLQLFGLMWVLLGGRNLVADLITWRPYLRWHILLSIFISALIPLFLGAFLIFLARWLESNPQYRFYAVVFLACAFLAIVAGACQLGPVPFLNSLLDGFNILGWGIVDNARKLAS